MKRKLQQSQVSLKKINDLAKRNKQSNKEREEEKKSENIDSKLKKKTYKDAVKDSTKKTKNRGKNTVTWFGTSVSKVLNIKKFKEDTEADLKVVKAYRNRMV